ncbi:unnamed protein product (macronuclear) [Paramecium tetraurelia]|uniref:Uncharacterized protein n=1 Tax=Paramecium tetraurelia TaxID=5888 RepID=A0C3B5_PARTE|nr:uncharacterized protein GSPATT00034761001 [Paramecium tetraurelia]CAK65282.1 unnamed protein product [Paramecium tetraurelia]|eukprot:XP_001432679.1 hypothetical protein (macronuclear) [Paramecium tetraurelia strain d4-2]
MSESEDESVLSEDVEQNEEELYAKKELLRIDDLKREQEKFLYKLSCEKPVKVTSVSKQELKDQQVSDKLSILFDEVEEEMDNLISKAKQYVQYINKKQGDENSSLPNTYLKTQPSILKKGKLTGYQLQGLNWLISMQEAGLNGILADQMGLGKTIQTIALLGFMKQFKNVSGPHLIVGPLSTIPNWERELSEWLPKCSVLKMMATEEWRHDFNKHLSKKDYDVIVASYECVINNERILNKYRFEYLIIDEAHKLKNEESLFFTTLKRLSSRFRLLLTGTPLQNNPHELWSLLNYLMPQLFTSSEAFDQWFYINKLMSEKEILQEKYEKRNMNMIEKAKSIIQAFMLRRTKSEVALDIPPKKEIHLYVQMTPLQKSHYRNMILNKKVVGVTTQKSLMNILIQLRKICQHLYMFPELEDRDQPSLGEHLIENSGKLKVLDMFLKKLYNENHKVILFSQFTSLLDILEDYLNYRKYKYCRLDGSTPIEVRDENIRNFQNPDSDLFIFLLSTRAGGLGITLTAADTVIIYDSDFNPQLDQQAMDRAHRIGQKKNVMVYRLICQSTVEEKIIERQQIKLRWEQMIIDKGHSQMVGMMNKKEDLKSIATYGASQILKDEPYTEEDIETLLKRGEELTEQLNQQIDQKFKIIKDKIDKVELGVKSIRVFDFFKDPNNEKDLQVIEQQIKLNQVSKQVEQSNKGEILPQFSKLCTEVAVEAHKFYSDPQQYKELMQRDENYKLYELYKQKNLDFQLDIELLPLTQMEEKQLNKLRQSGFEWRAKEFEVFLQSCIKYGRSDIMNIANSMGKTQKEIQQYMKVFNHRYDEIPDINRYMVRIEKTEAQLEQEQEFTDLLNKFMKFFDDPLLEMNFNQVYKQTYYTLESDQLIVYATYIEGFGRWDKIQKYILNHEMSFFDNYMRSLTKKSIKQRVLLLLKNIKKFVDSKNKKAKKSEQMVAKQLEEAKEADNAKQSKSRSNSKNRRKKKSKSVKKVTQSKKKKTKSPKPISSVKSKSIDQSIKEMGKSILKK